MIGATTSIGTLAIEFNHREFKITSVKSTDGKKIKPIKNVTYRLTHANIFEVVEGQEEAKFLTAAVFQWPLWGCSKDHARKEAIKMALEKVTVLTKEDRRKLWFAYLTRGTQPSMAPAASEPTPAAASAIVEERPSVVSQRWNAPSPPLLMAPPTGDPSNMWGV